MSGRHGSAEGFVTLAVTGLVVVLAAVTVLLAGIGTVALARHRAATAADLGALAAATRAVRGEDEACAAAGAVVRAHGAVLSSCRLQGWDAHVVATVRPAGQLGRWGLARARARAGPGAADGGPAHLGP